jgi:hypothetical protein
MVEYFANAPTRALCNFSSALACADADILASFGTAFADIAGGFDWVQCNQVTGTFSNALACRSSALGRSLPDVSGAMTDVSTGAGLMRLLRGRRMRCVRRLRGSLGLAVLTRGTLARDTLAGDVLAANGHCQRDESNG